MRYMPAMRTKLRAFRRRHLGILRGTSTGGFNIGATAATEGPATARPTVRPTNLVQTLEQAMDQSLVEGSAQVA